MAAKNYPTAIAAVFAEEGGFVNHPADPGGATNMGITQATLAAWRQRSVTVADVMALTRDEAEAIYRRQYADLVRFDDLPAGVDLMVLDFAVNSGPARAVKALQEAVGAGQDGVIGAKTLAAVARKDPLGLVRQIRDIRLAYLRKLSTWATFGKGWTKRVDRVTARAEAMAHGSPTAYYAGPEDATAEPAKAPPTDTRLTATAAGQGNLIAGVAAALGVGIEIAQQALPHVQALGDADIVKWLSIGIAIAAIVRNLLVERSRIAAG